MMFILEYELVIYEERKWTIYVHVNKINGKKYVGQTSQHINKRWGNNGCNYKNGHYFKYAINKYGWDNFDHIVVANNLTQKEANLMEKSLIKILKANDRNYGYNISIGGTGGNQKEIKSVKQYDLFGNFIKEYASAAEAAKTIGIHRTRITHACKNNNQANGYLWCYSSFNITEPYKRKNQKTVIQKTLEDEFVSKYISLVDASKQTGIGKDNIYRCIKGKNKSAGGYHWFYENNENENFEQLSTALFN